MDSVGDLEISTNVICEKQCCQIYETPERLEVKLVKQELPVIEGPRIVNDLNQKNGHY